MTQLRLRAQQGAELIVVTGGMGSTPDDVTAMTVAQFTKRDSGGPGAAQLPRPAPAAGFTDSPQGLEDRRSTTGSGSSGAAIVKPMGTAPAVVVPPQADEGIPLWFASPECPRRHAECSSRCWARRRCAPCSVTSYLFNTGSCASRPDRDRRDYARRDADAR